MINKTALLKTLTARPPEKLAIAFIDLLEIVAFMDGSTQNAKKMFLGGFRGATISRELDKISKDSKEAIAVVVDELTKEIN